MSTSEQIMAKTPQKQSQVTVQINTLDRELPQLHEVIDRLADGLASVLRQPSPNKESTNKDSEELVILANTIQDFWASVELAREKIDDLLSRLEL